MESSSAAKNQKATQNLLARAHSPDSVNRIYSEKIQHRTMLLRPTSPPPATVNARIARRKARQDKKAKQKQKPKPLSARARHSGPLRHSQGRTKYAIYEPLNKLWQGYIREVLGNDVYVGGPGASAKLASAEYHGAAVEVVRSRCPGRVGIQGIVVRDLKFVMEVVTPKRGLKVVPKEGTVFRVQVPVEGNTAGETTQTQHKRFVFDVLGDQMMLRAADRANKRFKAHFLTEL